MALELANAVRPDAVVIPFPPERIMVARQQSETLMVIYRGMVRTFMDPEHLERAFFPRRANPMPVLTGDQLAVTHDGVTLVYDSPEAFDAKLQSIRDEKLAKRRTADLQASPWLAQLHLVIADRPGLVAAGILFIGLLLALVWPR